MTNIERIACYIRVSHNEQKLHGLSLSAQRDTLQTYAKLHGLKIVEWYNDEGVSGRKLIKRRPALQKMLNDAREGKFDRIIFIKLDRYFRSVGEYYECQKILDSHNITWTATEEKYDLTTASGRYWVTQKLAMAEYEADNTGERIRLVNDYKIKTGQPLTGSHCLGLGYTVEKIDGVKRVVKDKENEEIINDFLHHFITHQGQRLSIDYIRNKYNVSWSYNSIRKVLVDEKICGRYKGNPNYCEPYITPEQFEQIQDIIKNKNVKRTQGNRVYIFTGLIACPKCGRILGAHNTGKEADRIIQTKNGPRKQKYKKIYNSYRCLRRIKEKSCDFAPYVSEEKVEKALLAHLDSYATAHIKEVTIQEQERRTAPAEDVIKGIKGEMTRLNTMFMKSRIEESEYDRLYKELEARLERATADLKPVERRDLTIYHDLIKSDWKSLYGALTQENKRAFWRRILKGVEVDEKGQFVKPIFF